MRALQPAVGSVAFAFYLVNEDSETFDGMWRSLGFK
jgi:hypothetical protein